MIEMEELDSGVRALIASFLSHEDLNSFVEVYPPTEEYFWSLMIKERFPKYYVSSTTGFKWKEVYVGLLDSDLTVFFASQIGRESPELFKYLIAIKNIYVVNEASLRTFFLNMSCLETIKFMFNSYTISLTNILDTLRNAFINNQIDIIRFVEEYYNTHFPQCPDLGSELIGDIDEILDASNLLPETFDLLWAMTKSTKEGGILDFFGCIDPNNFKLANHLLLKISLDIKRKPLFHFLGFLAFEGHLGHTMLLYKKFKDLLTIEDRRAIYEDSCFTYGDREGNPFRFLLE